MVGRSRTFSKGNVMSTNHRTYVVKYPPEFDGELHINTIETINGSSRSVTVSFTVAIKDNETVKQALQRAGMDMQRAN